MFVLRLNDTMQWTADGGRTLTPLLGAPTMEIRNGNVIIEGKIAGGGFFNSGKVVSQRVAFVDCEELVYNIFMYVERPGGALELLSAAPTVPDRHHAYFSEFARRGERFYH
jgi:hypothetical protein